ncbi:hypothetical protein BKA62DRAFT_770318 [Auriculariales sp. MPI-PUGE-AT-0066]|nr:hypothetical protein BKA62DRAFT_770318 [Auriculariales sp. MPI-PUGE-AT-0066]
MQATRSTHAPAPAPPAPAGPTAMFRSTHSPTRAAPAPAARAGRSRARYPDEDEDMNESFDDSMDEDGDESDKSEGDNDDDLVKLIDKVESLAILASGRRKKHEPHALALQEAIRQQFCESLGIQRVKVRHSKTIKYSDFPDPPVWDGAEPDPQKLTMFWTATPKHRYNCVAADIIAQRVIENPENRHLIFSCHRGAESQLISIQQISSQVLVSFQYFARLWKKQHNKRVLAKLTEEERHNYDVYEEERLQLHAADHRRSTLEKKRCAICDKIGRPEWKRIIEMLGAGGQSSDEHVTDRETCPNTFYVIGKVWRSEDVVTLCYLVDRVGALLKEKDTITRPNNTTKPNNMFEFRTRIPHKLTDVKSTRRSVQKLPKEFYSERQIETFGMYHVYPRPKRRIDVKSAVIDARKVVENLEAENKMLREAARA